MRLRTALLALVLTLAPASAASACPNCKESIPSSDAQLPSALPGGFNASIYYMLTGLAVVMGGIIGMIVKVARQTDAQLPATPGGFEPVRQKTPTDRE